MRYKAIPLLSVLTRSPATNDPNEANEPFSSQKEQIDIEKFHHIRVAYYPVGTTTQ